MAKVPNYYDEALKQRVEKDFAKISGYMKSITASLEAGNFRKGEIQKLAWIKTLVDKLIERTEVKND